MKPVSPPFSFQEIPDVKGELCSQGAEGESDHWPLCGDQLGTGAQPATPFPSGSHAAQA